MGDKSAFGGGDSGSKLVGVIVANQAARVGGAVVGDGHGAVGGDDFEIEIHQALAGNCSRLGAHAVGGVANGAGESVLADVAGVLAEAGIVQDPAQVVAFCAQGVRPAA